jgi:hypothetical protein
MDHIQIITAGQAKTINAYENSKEDNAEVVFDGLLLILSLYATSMAVLCAV